MTTYYNENDPKAAAWLRELIKGGHISKGYVDERSIKEVKPSDLEAYTRCHFFAGIGGWDHALNLAQWPEDRPVWTGSCPCQPFSAAGKGLGEADDRHLWPWFFRLIEQCGPATVFGEQVAAKAGREWLSRVRADLESVGYAVGAADLCAAGVSAPHIRQRLYWVANSGRPSNECWMRSTETLGPASEAKSEAQQRERCGNDIGGCGEYGGVAQSEIKQHNGTGNTRGGRGESSNSGRLGQPNGTGRIAGQSSTSPARHWDSIEPTGCPSGLADADGGNTSNGELQRGREHRQWQENGGISWLGDSNESETERFGQHGGQVVSEIEESGGCHNSNPWSRYDLIPCADGKQRRIESGSFPLAHGVPGRVGLLRGYGNAIVPQVAEVFIRSVMDIL